MSLEAQLSELTKAIQANTDAILQLAQAGGKIPAPAAKPETEKAPAKKSAEDKVSEKSPSAETAATASTAKVPATAASSAGSSEAGGATIDYNRQIKPGVLRLIAKLGRDDCEKWMQQALGVGSAKQLVPEQYAQALEAINAKIAEVEA